MIASMSMVASKRPDLIKKAFLEQEKNKAGIYTVKLYIRGRPTLISIDDKILFDYTTPSLERWSGQIKSLHYSRISQRNPSMWGPLLEKAMAKVGANTVHRIDKTKVQSFFGIFLYVVGTIFIYRYLNL